MPSDMLFRLMSMPVIPKQLVNEVDDVLSSHKITQKLPKPKSVQPIEDVHGISQPIIRFSSIDERYLPWQMKKVLWQEQWIDKKFVKAELFFSYKTGEIPARMGAETEFFTTRYQGKRYHQYRDIKAENKALRTLKKQLNSFKWLKTAENVSKNQATIELTKHSTPYCL